jgi:serine phosphatase RsbU (regulator of sigma subunit)
MATTSIPTDTISTDARIVPSYRVSLVLLVTAYLCLGVIDLIRFLMAMPEDLLEMYPGRVWIRLSGYLVTYLILISWLILTRNHVRTREEVNHSASLLILLIGMILLASRFLLQTAIPYHAAWGLVDIAALHITACLFLPWTARESTRPFVPLLVVWAVAVLLTRTEAWGIMDRFVAIICSWLVLVPGALLAGWRTRRREEDIERLALRHQVRSAGAELSRARIVHDAMFPPPCNDGPIEFEYEYLPIADIGGDYVHFHRDQHSGKVYLTLLDVAGHGLAAALSVNRLFGELERIRAEDPDASPVMVMELLNRYINLTMSQHSMFATGACFLLDPSNGTLTWVNAGHPPALLRRANGDVEDVPGTTMLLGALPAGEFEAAQRTVKLQPGDVVIAYTDGAFEARDSDGKQLGIEHLRQTARFSPPPRSWPKFIAHAVAAHHDGNADDDVLIAALTLKSLRIPPAPNVVQSSVPQVLTVRDDAPVSA